MEIFISNNNIYLVQIPVILYLLFDQIASLLMNTNKFFYKNY